VGLEWSKQKSKDSNYGNKKGWFAVCELMPAYHAQAIAEADGDDEDIREAYAINDAFYELVLAAPQRDQTRPLIRRAEDATDSS